MMTFRFIPNTPDTCDIAESERFSVSFEGRMSNSMWSIQVDKVTESLYISRSKHDNRQGRFLRVIDDKIDSYKI